MEPGTDEDPYYQQLFDDVALESWSNPYSSLPPLAYPESLEERSARSQYASDLERDYLWAFAGYRLVQLALHNQQLQIAQTTLQTLQTNSQPGDHGHVYVMMAEALLQNYEVTNDLELACQAAAVAFNNIRVSDDPGIEYFDEPGMDYDFYYATGVHYGSNPDNLFAVPRDIEAMINIPICLQAMP